MTKLVMDGRELRHFEADFSAGADSLVLADGTLWSHAAVMGDFVYGDTFSIDQSTIENFVKVFSQGYPQKIPVDYEHASTTDNPEVTRLRAQGRVPKAGDVAELKGVFSVADFTGELRAAAEKMSAKVGRPLDDPRNLGLWMRWKPTAQALAAIKAGEYTELSIAFDSDWPHKNTGEGQGPAILAVGLVTRPFLDEMLSVAASSDRHQAPGQKPDATHSPERPVMNQKLISLVAALRNKVVATDDEAVIELEAFRTEVTELRAANEFRSIIAPEFENEKDPAKVVAKVRELRSELTASKDAAATQKKADAKKLAETTIKQFESRIGNVPLRDKLTRDLTRELEAGTEIDKAETMIVLKALAPDQKFGQSAAGDVGGAGVGDDVKIDARARELMQSDPRLKAMAASNSYEAYKEAVVAAGRELVAVTK